MKAEEAPETLAFRAFGKGINSGIIGKLEFGMWWNVCMQLEIIIVYPISHWDHLGCWKELEQSRVYLPTLTRKFQFIQHAIYLSPRETIFTSDKNPSEKLRIWYLSIFYPRFDPGIIQISSVWWFQFQFQFPYHVMPAASSMTCPLVN